MKPKNEAVRRQIIDAATALIIEYGIAGTSTVKVANRINGAQSNIYSYFKSKEELINGVFVYHQNMMTNAIAPIFTGSKTPKELIAALVSELLLFADKNPESIQIIAAFRAQPNLRDQLPTIGESEVFTKMFNLFAQYQQAGIIKPAPAEFLAESVFSIIVNYGNAKLANEPYVASLSENTIVQLITDFIFIKA